MAEPIHTTGGLGCSPRLLATIALALVAPAMVTATPLPPDRLAIESAAGRIEFQVELAATPAQRSQGLMFRRHLPADRGMLFDFGTSRPVTMWMRNTYIPLDMLFIEPDGRILRIEHGAQPLSETIITSGGPVRAVLEIPGGTAAQLGIGPGDQVLHPIFADAPDHPKAPPGRTNTTPGTPE